jgi:hypothetical protein
MIQGQFVRAGSVSEEKRFFADASGSDIMSLVAAQAQEN